MKRSHIDIIFRLAVAVCFICHGVMAWRSAGVAYSEWNVWLQRLLPTGGYAFPSYFLRTVGTIDIVAAVLLLTPRVPKFALVWVIGWAGMTSLSRVYFLGSFDATVWVGIARPAAEVLSRAANWIVPLLLYNRLCDPSRRLFPKVEELSWMRIAVAAYLLSMAFAYLVEFNSDIYPFEVLRTGQSLWYFHLSGAIAILALASVQLRRSLPQAFGRSIVAALPFIALIMAEAFSVIAFYWPRGIGFTLLQMGEHIPIYLSFSYVFARGEHQSIKGLRAAAAVAA